MWTSVAILAVLKAGASFVLLHHAYPRKRLRSVVQQVGARHVLSSSTNTLDTFADIVEHVLVVDYKSINRMERRTEILSSGRSGTNLTNLYIMFTSGSTDTPKGVMNLT